jgi:hypothetical protein
MRSIAVAGVLAGKPGNGGEAWVRLSWVLGLRRLGFDAWLVEQLDGRAGPAQTRWFERVASAYGLSERAVLVAGGELLGPLSRPELERLADESELLVNISGNLRDEALLERFPKRVYVDLDPGFTQLWLRDGVLAEDLTSYDACFSVGLALASESCDLPSGGVEWQPLPPPVLLERWPPVERPAFDRFTSVATWRNPYGPVAVGGQTLRLKHHEFRRFRELPKLVDAAFELALDIHPADGSDRQALVEAGWRLRDPRAVAGDPAAFRGYVRGSGAEVSVAQGVYAQTRSGWMSDRTAHYLASGRPALVQDTGLPDEYAPGEGLLTFTTLDDAAAGAERIVADYERQAGAARALAEELLDSDVVLGRMLDAVGVAREGSG